MSKELIDSFQISSDQVKWELNEEDSQSVVDGVNILGRAVGPFFVVDGDSLNGRHYTKSLWERAIDTSRERLQYGEMLGTIGHDQKLDDQALLEGKVSHKVTKLWIDESTGVGMGEIQILSTPAGQALNSYLRGGVRLKVSSRALGEYKGKTKSGSNIIDESTFNLKGFDFVQTPGVSTAIPVLVEHHEEISTDNPLLESNKSENNNMTEIAEQLSVAIKEKYRLEESLNTSTEKVTSLTEQVRSLSDLVESKSKIIESSESKIQESSTMIESLQAQVADLHKTVESYKVFGTSEELNTKLTKYEEQFKAYNELGSPEQLTEALDKVSKLVEELSDLGTPAQISEALDITTSYLELGTPSQITTALNHLESYIELGSPDDLSAKLNLVASYEALGSVSDIEEAFNLTESTLSEIQEKKTKQSIAEFAKKYSIEESIASMMVSKHGIDEATTLMDKLKVRTDISDRYNVNSRSKPMHSPLSEELKNHSKKTTDTSINESYSETNLASRVMKRLSK